MNRRDALSRVALLLGGTVVGAEVFLKGCKPETKYGTSLKFAPEDVAYLDEVAETILPRTSTPGAKAARVGQFMTVIVNDCYEEGDQKTFHEGMKQLNDAFDKKYSTSFMKGTPQQRHDFLVELDKEAKEHQRKRGEARDKNKD